jgi:FMN phosphatase YigB (HAD superfamily)
VPEDCLFIDDSPPNVEGARAVGMRGHHFRAPDQLRAELKAAGLPLA